MQSVQIPSLFALAYDPSEQARAQLAAQLSDILVHRQATLSLRETELLHELIELLLINGSPAIHAKLAEHFTDAQTVPRRIASQLSRGDIEVARDILIHNSMLADDDLIDILEQTSRDHALAICSRASLSEAVADALVTTGDLRVMLLVAENMGATLSDRSIDVMADAARFAAELRQPVLYRPEMSSDAATRLYWWIDQDLRRYALKRFGIGKGQIDQALAETISAFLADHAFEKNNDIVMHQLADWLEIQQALSPQILPQVLRMGHFRLFNILLARLAQLRIHIIDSLTHEAGGRGLAAICCAIGIDKPGFVSLFLLSRGGRRDEHLVHPRELTEALAAYDRVTPAIAQDLLRSWKTGTLKPLT